MNIESKIIASYNYFSLNGRLNNDCLIQMQQHIDDKMKHGSRYFIFDLSQLEYICSGGLRIFIKTQKQLKLFDGLLSLVAPTDHVSKVLEIAELNEILHIEKDILSATNEFL